MTGNTDCCARAANGHDAAAPRSVMNSRLSFTPGGNNLIDC